MAIEDKLQGILDQLKCADRSIACILEKGLIFDKSTPSGDVERGLVEVVDQGLIKIVDHPEAGELEMSLVDSVVDFEGKTVQQSIEEIEGVTIENEFRVQSRRTEEIPEEV